MERQTSLALSKSSPSLVTASVSKKLSPRAITTRLRKAKAVVRRYHESKRSIVPNNEKLGPANLKPYFIFEETKNLTPRALYDPQFPSVSEKFFMGLPMSRPPKLSKFGTERMHETSSVSSITSFASRISVTRRSSLVPSLLSFGLTSVAEMSFRSVVLESDDEEELQLQITDRAPSMFRLREDPSPRNKEVITEFKVDLEESTTHFWLEIPSTAYDEESEEGVAVKERNLEYERVKSGSKTISHTAMQTTRMFQKHQQLYVPRNSRANSSAYATVWDIYDVMEEDRRLSTATGLSREEGMVIRVAEVPLEEESNIEMFEFCGQQFSFKLLKALMIMERLVIKDNFCENQLLFQGLLLEDPLSLDVNFNYNLTNLWTFSCEKTKKRNVTSIAGSPVNENIIAVGYGKFYYTDKCNGLVCIWNVKNPQDPERTFEFKDPVTFLAFSVLRPHVLAISFYSGLVLLIDIISRSLKIKASNYHYPLYYPVWQILWFQQGEDNANILLSCGKDGKVYRYKKTKFFISKKIMSMGRPHGAIQGIEQAKKCYPRKTLLNHHPSAEVMISHPTDPMMYVIGTSEGFVYFCSINHRHDHIDVFVAHDGPIYNIQFNPFCSKIFLTCGADWSIRIWAEGIFEPLVTLESGMSSIQHAVWDPLRSTIIVSITGNLIEVWDIRRRISVPKSTNKSPSGSFNTVIQFTQNKFNMCLGDIDGNVHVMALTQMPFSPTFQDVVLAQSLRNMLVTRPDLLELLEKLGKPFASDERSYKTKMYRQLDKLQKDL